MRLGAIGRNDPRCRTPKRNEPRKTRGHAGLAKTNEGTRSRNRDSVYGRRRPKRVLPCAPDTRRKIKGKAVKYESPREQPNRVYVPPGVGRVLDDPQVELIVTEGEFKALAAMQAVGPCIGLVGVYGWKEKRGERLLPELERIAWQGRPVRIVFDSDLEHKPDVRSAEARLAKHLNDRGAIVRCVRLPDGPAGDDGQPTKMGLDDFLVAHGAGELRKLIDAAIEPPAVEGPDGKEDAIKIDPSDEAKTYRATLQYDGLSRLRRHWHGVPWLWRDGAYHEREQGEVRADLIRAYWTTPIEILAAGLRLRLDYLEAPPGHLARGDMPPGTWPPMQRPDGRACSRNSCHSPPDYSPPDARCRPRRCDAPCDPRLFTTAALDVDFDARAPRPNAWLRFLSQLWPDDRAATDTLQTWVWVLVTSETRQQKILLLVGPRRSGKGTIGRVVRELVGHANVCGQRQPGQPGGKLRTLAAAWKVGGHHLGRAPPEWANRQRIVIERLLSIGPACESSVCTIYAKYREPVTVKLPTRLMISTSQALSWLEHRWVGGTGQPVRFSCDCAKFSRRRRSCAFRQLSRESCRHSALGHRGLATATRAWPLCSWKSAPNWPAKWKI